MAQTTNLETRLGNGALPNFFIVGTAKTGSTSIANFFEQHPNACFCKDYEPNFFAFDKLYEHGIDSYRNLYSHYDGEKVIGEKSWRYSCSTTYPQTLNRMLAAVPSFKVIYIVRDPLPRAISMWRELRDGGREVIPADPNVALTEDGLILDSSRYHYQIQKFVDAVGDANVKIMLYEDFKTNPATFYREMCEFLGIEVREPKETLHVNRSVGQRSDTPILEQIRKLGLDGPLRKYSPGPIRNLARHVLKRPIGKVKITPETRESFFNEVGDDCRRLLDRIGRDHHVWTLE